MRNRRSGAVALLLLALASCGHGDSYLTPESPSYGAFGGGSSVPLSFNPDQNYWPAWTADGRGILYAYVDAESASPPQHRCLGMLPATGGTRIWQLCDNRAVRNDTVSSYSGYALSSDGKLLVAEATAPANLGFEPLPTVSLWLSDTGRPYVRTTLLRLPQTVDGFGVTWLAEVRWTGPNTFLALGQQLNTLPHCSMCQCFPCPRDSIFADAGMVLAGTISGGTATLRAVAGTDSATSYSLAENGTSIVFTRHHDLHLFKVPIDGGTPVPMPVQRAAPDTADFITAELVGVSCKQSSCVVASDGVFLTDAYSVLSPCTLAAAPVCQLFAKFLVQPGNPPIFRPMTLMSVSLATGASTVLQSESASTSQVFASPQISPTSGDVVVQRGGVWGHLQTFATPARGNGQLVLLKAIVP
jgi:hypothetical protein